MGANVLVEFENVIFNWGHFLTIGGIFFFKLGAKNYFGIEKICYFGNYMDPWILVKYLAGKVFKILTFFLH